MLDEALTLQLPHILPDTILVEVILVALVDTVQEVEIEIARPGTFKAHMDFVLSLLLALTCKGRGIEFVGQVIA